MLAPMRMERSSEADHDERDLDEYLDRHPTAMPLDWCHGFFVALASIPALVPASAWVERVFDGPPDFKSSAEAEWVLGGLMRGQGDSLVRTGDQLAVACPAPDDVEGLTVWCDGYLSGLDFTDVREEARDPGATVALLIIAAIAGALPDQEFEQLVEKWPNIDPEESAAVAGRDADAWVAKWRTQVPLLATICHESWRAKREKLVRRGASEGRPPKASTAKAGRNDPCPCGSGKKYKKCCA